MNKQKLYKGQASYRSESTFGMPSCEVQVMATSRVEAREKLQKCNPGAYISLRPK